MGAEDNGGRRRAGAGYLEQGPAKSAEEVVIGLLGDAFSEARRGMPTVTTDESGSISGWRVTACAYAVA